MSLIKVFYAKTRNDFKENQMNAKEAYELAASKGDISALLLKIRNAAEAGQTEITIPMINEFQVAALRALEYVVYAAQDPRMQLISGRSEHTHHKISWLNGGGSLAQVFGKHFSV